MNLMKRALVRLVVTTIVLSNFITILKVELWIMVPHAAKYGHERYGKTYEGVYKDWQPGQKVHLVGHSMGGQTIRQLEALLRNGNPEEQEYQHVHGGDISPLYQGQNDNMISSITTLGTPHNGTHASDLLGNEALIRQVVFDAGKVLGNKDSRRLRSVSMGSKTTA